MLKELEAMQVLQDLSNLALAVDYLQYICVVGMDG